MNGLQDAMRIFKEQLQQGDLITAYQGLMVFFRDLRSHFEKQFPDYKVPSNIYYGYLDMTYFALIPPALESHRLKIAVVFEYATFRFEAWLSGANRDVQARAWGWLKDSDWDKHRLADDPRTIDYILAHVLVDDPDFSDLPALTAQIERGTLDFIWDVEGFLSTKKN
jgi:hypothetical protein